MRRGIPRTRRPELYFLYNNFGRVHQTLGVTPALKVGLSDHVWGIETIVRSFQQERSS